MKTLYKIQMRALLSSLVLILTISSLKASDTSKAWKVINKGKWETTDHYRAGDYIVRTDVLGNASNPVMINGKPAISPINIWSMQDSTFVAMSNNWVGDPMNPMQVFKYDSCRLFITDGLQVYRADISFDKKTITYEKIIQGTNGIHSMRHFFKADNAIYFVSSLSKHFVYVCDNLGHVQKTLEVKDSSIYLLRSIAEWKDTVYLGYDFMGGMPDGSGLAILNTANGQIKKIRNQDWSSNLNGCYLKVINGHFYLRTDPGTHRFTSTLYEYIGGKWIGLMDKASMPEYWWNGGIIVSRGKGSIDLRTGDTSYECGTNGNALYYHFDNSTLGSKIGTLTESVVDQRTNLSFTNDFSAEFFHEFGYTPSVEFVYEFNGKIIGFGPNFVAELVDQNTAINSITLTPVSVYPNPAHDILYLKGIENPESYTMCDMTGKTVLVGNTMDAIDISSLQTGIYVLYLNFGKFAKITKD